MGWYASIANQRENQFVRMLVIADNACMVSYR